MTPPLDDRRRELVQSVFRMPSVQTMVSRKSSITNAFVNAVIPVVAPTLHEIAEALSILGLDPEDVRCAYCGDRSTEWDHLRPLVLKRRPTGFVSEIANLVPACGKCNQSKGNKEWRQWMLSNAKLSPTGRRLPGVHERIARLEAYAEWREPTRVDFETLLGRDAWEHYWSLCEAVIGELRDAQAVADDIKSRIAEALKESIPEGDEIL